jgi:thioredoxin-dependent peroxiredoxin
VMITSSLRLTASMAVLASACAFSGLAPLGRVGVRSALRGGAQSFATQTKMQLKEGDAIPNVVFKARVRDEKIGGPNPFTWKDVKSADLFKGKRAVIFSLPGAFTPTCSSTHLPGYEKAYEEIKSYGIDDIYCLSVNDAFVMRQWGLHQGLPEEKTSTQNPLNPGNFQKVKLLPDGACLFTRGMGMSSTWDSERGFGERSWRYSAVFNDMKIEKLFVEVCRHFPAEKILSCSELFRRKSQISTETLLRVS